MRLSEKQFKILKLFYDNKDRDVVFTSEDLSGIFPDFEYRDVQFMRKKGCFVELGHETQPSYIISKPGEEFYLEHLDRQEDLKMQRRSFRIAMASLVLGTISAIASVVAAVFAFLFR